jgi:hypothetical protein
MGCSEVTARKRLDEMVAEGRATKRVVTVKLPHRAGAFGVQQYKTNEYTIL